MSQPEAGTKNKVEVDRDILAIRSLVEADAPERSGAVKQAQAAAAQPKMQMSRTPKSEAPRKRDDLPPLRQSARDQMDECQAKGTSSAFAGFGQRIGELTTHVARMALERARTYDPDTKTILRTSLVLLLILRPFLVIGWVLFAAFLVLLTYLFMGPDRFWRQIIALHRAFARRRPEAARVLKLRAYVIARKWDGLLCWVPQGLADMLRSPDLRELIAADARHDEAMAKRLGRLGEDLAF